MSVNKHVPHVFVVPEDDANRQLANGFNLDPCLDTRRMQIDPEAGGWLEVLNCFKTDHVPEMAKNANRHVVLLIDFDNQEERLEKAKALIPDELKERVFIIGAWSNPEELRQYLGSYETIGRALAEECRNNTEEKWAHRLLRHNAGELDRLRKHVRPILFK